PSDDPSAPADCLGNPNRAPYVRAEGERWVASPTPVTPPTQIVGTTDLSVLARPRTSEDVLPAPLGWRGAAMLRGHELQPDDARLALRTGGLRVFVVPAGEGWVCLQVYGPPAGTGGTCNPTEALVTFGAIPLYQGAPGGRIRAIGLVGDGFDTITAPDGRSAPIVNNVFVMDTVHGAKLTLSGPAGRHRISVF
ncbi:MAG: hypothetical protein QOK40_2685, partial [Miltoncostaeaceae bacterium]|nr:hypothetical protein [Miltoncostaeaceae bacterium]